MPNEIISDHRVKRGDIAVDIADDGESHWRDYKSWKAGSKYHWNIVVVNQEGIGVPSLCVF